MNLEAHFLKRFIENIIFPDIKDQILESREVAGVLDESNLTVTLTTVDPKHIYCFTFSNRYQFNKMKAVCFFSEHRVDDFEFDYYYIFKQ